MEEIEDMTPLAALSNAANVQTRPMTGAPPSSGAITKTPRRSRNKEGKPMAEVVVKGEQVLLLKRTVAGRSEWVQGLQHMRGLCQIRV